MGPSVATPLHQSACMCSVCVCMYAHTCICVHMYAHECVVCVCVCVYMDACISIIYAIYLMVEYHTLYTMYVIATALLQ